MSDIEKRIGGKITEIRLSQKLTQAQLAEKVNLLASRPYPVWKEVWRFPL